MKGTVIVDHAWVQQVLTVLRAKTMCIDDLPPTTGCMAPARSR